ncbi:MAG: ORF2 [Torque teno virus AZ6_5]|nr:MAG: ORF2 [Torque teno virus AZ6_5]
MPWSPPTANLQGRENSWLQSVFLSHATFCGCPDPVGHLHRVYTRQQSGGPSPPRTPTGAPALPAPPSPDPPPRPGGELEGGRGDAGGEGAGAYREEDLEELFAAARDDDM